MRYAVYYVPRSGSALAALGASMLGYDVHARTDVPLPDHPLYRNAEFSAALAEPRRYGFHATLKPPFMLRDDATEEDLMARVIELARLHDPIAIEQLEVAALGRFIALVPFPEPATLRSLAADCVTSLDALRAPLLPADRARRLAKRLTDRQIANLDRYGYPHVLDDFRFHLTLTGPLPVETLTAALEVIVEMTAQVRNSTVIDELAVCIQPSRDERFQVLARFPLGRR